MTHCYSACLTECEDTTQNGRRKRLRGEKPFFFLDRGTRLAFCVSAVRVKAEAHRVLVLKHPWGSSGWLTFLSIYNQRLASFHCHNFSPNTAHRQHTDTPSHHLCTTWLADRETRQESIFALKKILWLGINVDGHSWEECSGFVGGGGNFERCGKRADKHCQHMLPLQVGTREEENERARRSARKREWWLKWIRASGYRWQRVWSGKEMWRLEMAAVAVISRQQLWQMKDRRVINLLRIPAVVLATGSTSGRWGAHTCSLRVRILLDNLNM